MGDEQNTNTSDLTPGVSVYTVTPPMGRPPKPANERRSVLFPLRLTPGEMAELQEADRRRGETVAEILRAGAKLQMARGKGESKRKEKQ